jgi:hypothetical protein
VGIIILAGLLAGQGWADGKGPEVLNIDHKISIHADGITLGRLLRLWDEATGMQSTVPPQLLNLKLSVRFTNLSMNDALRKIFEGQPFDYILLEDQVVIVARAQSESVAESGPEPKREPIDNDVPQAITQPVLPESSRMKPAPPQLQPTTIPTPFGPILSPRWNQQPFIQLPPVPGAPPTPPFFVPVPQLPSTSPAGMPNWGVPNGLFGPLPTYP